MMDRWWPPVFLIGLALGALSWWLYQDLFTRLTQSWKWMTLSAVGGLCLLAALLMLILRSSAYVRPYADHFLIATPLLRMNVSYKRVRRTATASMVMLFPPARMSFLKRDTIEPLLSRTAVVVDLTALPMSRTTLSFFLSPFFFKDNTPHLVILVRNWMSFSTELESMRASGSTEAPTVRRPQSSILTQLPRK